MLKQKHSLKLPQGAYNNNGIGRSIHLILRKPFVVPMLVILYVSKYFLQLANKIKLNAQSLIFYHLIDFNLTYRTKIR